MTEEDIRTTLAAHGFELISLIGQGGFAKCYKVYSNQYKQFFACKVISLDDKKLQKQKSFRNECAALVNIIHPNIIHVYKTIDTKSHQYIILEYCPNGDLEMLIRKNGPLTKSGQLYGFLSRIISALIYLEENNFAHNDIKPSNILIDSYYRPKLADFGLSKKVFSENDFSNEFGGSLAYTAPEILCCKPYNPMKADIWSFGVLVYYLSTGTLPFPMNNYQQFKLAVNTGSYSLPLKLDPTIRKIITRTLVVDPTKRIPLQAISDLIETEVRPDNLILHRPVLPPLYNSQNASSMLCKKSLKFTKVVSRLHTFTHV